MPTTVSIAPHPLGSLWSYAVLLPTPNFDPRQCSTTHRLMKSVFRLAARRARSVREGFEPGSAPVSEKRVGLSRGPTGGYGRLTATAGTEVRPFEALRPVDWEQSRRQRAR